MTYQEAEKKVQENKDLIGKPLFQYTVEHLVISPLNELGDIVVTYYKNGFNNKTALEEAGLLNNKNLKIFLFPARYIASQFVSELEVYLARSASKK
jgi:hypothetical protein